MSATCVVCRETKCTCLDASCPCVSCRQVPCRCIGSFTDAPPSTGVLRRYRFADGHEERLDDYHAALIPDAVLIESGSA